MTFPCFYVSCIYQTKEGLVLLLEVQKKELKDAGIKKYLFAPAEIPGKIS